MRAALSRFSTSCLVVLALTPYSVSRVAAGALDDGRRVQASGAGLLVVTDPRLDRVVVFDVNGERPDKLLAFGTQGLKPGEFDSPHGASINGFRELFVTDSSNHRIQVFDLGPTAMGRAPRVIRVFGAHGNGSGELETPLSGVAIPKRLEPDHLVYVADHGNGRVQVFDRFGKPTGLVIGGRGAEEGKLDEPAGLAFDPKGEVLYVAEKGNHRVSAFEAKTGRFLFKFGHRGSGESEMHSPEGLAVGSTGRIFVTDPGSRRILRFNPESATKDGLIRGVQYEGAWAFIGDKPRQWTHPQSVAIDGKDRVYVSDLEDGRLQMFGPGGTFVASFGDDLAPSPAATVDVAPGSKVPSSMCSNGERYQLRLRPTPDPIPFNRPFGLEVEVLQGCSSPQPTSDVKLTVEAVMPEPQQHGMRIEPGVEELGGGRFQLKGQPFQAAGHWELRFDITKDKILERAQVDLIFQ